MSLERLKDLLKEKAFVDYFNLFLSQPIFEYRMMYQFYKMEFTVDSRLLSIIKEMTRSKLFHWIEVERLPLFIQTPLYAEYKFCCELKKLELNIEMFPHVCDHPGCLDKTLVKLIVENVFGHYVGMQQFKHFLCETDGGKTWQCIQDVTLYYNQNINAEMKHDELHQLILKYLANGVLRELTSRLKLQLFLDSDPLENYKSMENSTNFVNGICFDDCLFHKETLHKEPNKALERFYIFLLQDMLTYWAPNFVIHLLQQRINFQLQCLCKLSFTEEIGTMTNINHLFDFTHHNCPVFLTTQETFYSQKEQCMKPSLSFEEYLFDDGRISKIFDSKNKQMMNILTSDRFSGHPFLKFLMQESQTNGDQILLLWEDLCKYINMTKTGNHYVKKLQEKKIKRLYLLAGTTSEDDLLNDDIKQIISSGFEMSDEDENEMMQKFVKAIDMCSDILKSLWEEYIQHEMNKMKNVSEVQSTETDLPSTVDLTSMCDMILCCIDISNLKENNMLACFFSEEELNNLHTSICDHARPYTLGNNVCELMKQAMNKKYGRHAQKKKPKKKKVKDTLKIMSTLKKKLKVITCDQKTKEKTKLRNYNVKDANICEKKPATASELEAKDLMKIGIDIKKKERQRLRAKAKLTRYYGMNPNLSLKQENVAFHTVDSNRKKYMFRKYLLTLCQFLSEMLQPHMKPLLIAYVDALEQAGDFQLAIENTAAERRAKNMRKGPLNYHATVYKPSSAYFEAMKKKIIFLSDSLQFHKNAYTMLKSSKRTRLNLCLRKKAREIITNFQEEAVFSQTPNEFVFGRKLQCTEAIVKNTLLKLKLEGATCGLFYGLNMHVIPSIYTIWKRMGRDCINCGGRGTFLAALNIDRVSFDEKYPVKIKEKMVFKKPEKIPKDAKVLKPQLEEQATLMTKSMRTLLEEDDFRKFRKQFPFVEYASPAFI